MKRRVWLGVLILVLIGIGLPACNLPYPPLAAGDGTTPTTATQQLPGEIGGGVAAPDTPPSSAGETPTEQPCGYMWASQPLPEVSSEIQAMLEEAGIEQARVNAEAFGENCLLPDGQIARFLVMQTDIRIVLGVESVADLNALGDLAERILPVVLGIPNDALPGPNEGYLGLQFNDANGQLLNIWLPIPAVRELMRNQPGGSMLIERLQQK